MSGARRGLFTDEACDLISFATRGTRRRINILCNTALMYDYATEEQTITSEIVQKVLEDKRSYGVFPMPSGLGQGTENRDSLQIKLQLVISRKSLL